MVLDCEQIKAVFEGLFHESHRICLRGGAAEPLYLPAGEGRAFNELFHTRDYAASALHEIAHWCLARPEQLLQKDWGHWYQPDGRTAEQQRIFERAEARVQALEWILCVAAGLRFRPSTDNLSGEVTDDAPFHAAIYMRTLRYCREGLPERAAMLVKALVLARGAEDDLVSLLPQVPEQYFEPRCLL